MPQQFSNNARSVLQSSITDTATSLTIAAGAADLFPTANVGTGSIPSVNNWFKATIQDVSGNVEIIYVRTRNAGSAVFSNILRGQEGTTARTFVAGSVVGLRVTAADIQASVNLPGANTTYAGSNTYLQPVIMSAGANFGGNFTTLLDGGKLTVKFNNTTIVGITNTGTIEGTATNATDAVNAVNATNATKLTATNFTVEEAGGGLAFIARNTFTASISGTVLTASTATAGTVNFGATLTGTNVSGGTVLGAQLTSTETAVAKNYISGGAPEDTNFVVSSAAGIVAGQLVAGTGIPAGTFVTSSYTGGTTISLVNRLGVPVAFTQQAVGSYSFAAPAGKGTYTVNVSQTVAQTTITGTKTVASLTYAGVLSTNSNVIAGGNVIATGTA
jgi:hypothetical protein